MKKSQMIGLVLVALMVVPALGGCLQQSNGDHVLLVQLASEDEAADELSELQVVRDSLERGGSINVNVSTARQIDKEFDAKYAVMNTEGSFLILPAVLNWVGGNGWHLVGPSLGGWLFTKPR